MHQILSKTCGLFLTTVIGKTKKGPLVLEYYHILEAVISAGNQCKRGKFTSVVW